MREDVTKPNLEVYIGLLSLLCLPIFTLTLTYNITGSGLLSIIVMCIQMHLSLFITLHGHYRWSKRFRKWQESLK